MTGEMALLIGSMAAVTFAGKALPLLVPWIDRLPDRPLRILRLIAPATLAALAASGALLARSDGRVVLALSPLLPAVLTAAMVWAWRRSMPLAIGAAACVAAVLRALLGG